MISTRCPHCSAWLRAETPVELSEFDEAHVFWCYERCRLRDFDEFTGPLLEEFGRRPMMHDPGPNQRVPSSNIVTPSMVEHWLASRGFPGWQCYIDGNELKLTPPVLVSPVGFSVREVSG